MISAIQVTNQTTSGDTLQVNGGYANVTNNQLEVSALTGSGWRQAGKVTKHSCDVQALYPASNNQGFEVVIDVTSMGALKEMGFLISSNDPTTTQDPASLSNWYRIVKNASNSTVMVQNRLNGDTVSTKASTSWAGSTGQLKIKVSTGSIAFYENGVLKYAEPFALPSTNCYIYAYANSDQNGTGTFDNFAIYPAQNFRTEFNGSDLDGWTTDSGSWTAQNGKLQSTNTGSHIHYTAEFAKNRHVRADIQSLSNGGDRNVAWLIAKEIDGNNMVYGLIRTGYVELGIHYDGQQHFYPSDLFASPNRLTSHGN